MGCRCSRFQTPRLERLQPSVAGAAQSPHDYAWHWGDNGPWKNFVLAHPGSRSALAIFTNGNRGLNVAQRLVVAATGEDHPAFQWL
jgi:hypothetical protein